MVVLSRTYGQSTALQPPQAPAPQTTLTPAAPGPCSSPSPPASDGRTHSVQPPRAHLSPPSSGCGEQGPRATQLMSLAERPDDPGDAAREAVVDHWTLALTTEGSLQAVRVRPLLELWDTALRAQYHGAHESALFGGSIVNYRLNPAWRAQRPADIDPLFIVPGGAQGCVQTLQMRAMTALSAVFADKGWALPSVLSHILDDDRASALVLMTLKSQGAHIDVRLAFDDSLAAAFDFRCNGLVCDLRETRRWGVLPGLDMKTVVDENNQGVYTQVRPLKRDSVKRGTKMRMRGFVPGNAALDQALVPTFVAFLNAHPQAGNKGFGLLFAEWLHRLLADYDDDKASGNNASTTFLLNLIVQIRQAHALPQTSEMLSQLRRALDGYTRRIALSAPTQSLVQALQSDAVSARALESCLDALATDTEHVLDASHKRCRFEVKRVMTSGAASVRVYIPELSGYVIWPLGRGWRLDPEASWPEAQAAQQGVAGACAWLGHPTLSALWDGAARAERDTSATQATHLARLAMSEGLAPSWRLRLLWAAHCLDTTVELDDAFARALRSGSTVETPAHVRQASEALDRVHKQRGGQRLERILLDPHAASEARQAAFALARTWLTEDPGSPAARSCLHALTRSQTFTAEETRGLREIMQVLEPGALDEETLAAVLGLWATSMHQVTWAPLQHALTRFPTYLTTCPQPVQERVWQRCAAHLSEPCLWHIAARVPHLFRTSSPDIPRRWLQALAPQVLATESVFMAQLLATLKPCDIVDILAVRQDLVTELLRTQTGYIAIGRLLANSAATAGRIHIERLWLQADADYVPSAALHVCGIMQPTDPLFLSTVTRALKQQKTLSDAAQIQLLNQLWGKLQRTHPNHRTRMQRLVRAALMQISLLKLDRLTPGAWPKAQTLRQWAALFAQSSDAEHMRIHLICAFIGNARRDIALVLEFMGQASTRRAEGEFHMPALMALFYHAIALLADKPAEDVARAGAMLARMTKDANPKGLTWDHDALVTWRETALGLLRLGDLTYSADILEHMADGPHAPQARECIYNSDLTLEALIVSDTDSALRYALKNHDDEMGLFHNWAGQLTCELLNACVTLFDGNRVDEAHHVLDRALFLLVHRKPQDSFWRADPVFSALVGAFSKCPDRHMVQCFFDTLHEADLHANLTHIDIRMLVRNRAVFEIAWVQAVTHAPTARQRALACLTAFGIDTCLTRPLAETLLDNPEEAEPLCLVVAQIAGALCYPCATDPAEAQARLAWIIEGLSHAPAPTRALYNLSLQTASYDPMAATKVGLHLTMLLAAAVDAQQWTRATALASLSLQFTCAVVFETHPKHAINLVRATVVRLCQIPNARWRSWRHLLNAVETVAASALVSASDASQEALRASVAALHKATVLLDARVAKASSDAIAVLDPPDPEALFKNAQFTIIMSEMTDGPPLYALRTLMARLSTMEDDLAHAPELTRYANAMVATSLQSKDIQHTLLTNVHGIAKIDLRLLTRLVDGMRTWRPICEEGYACILEKAVQQRLNGENKGQWDSFLTHLFAAMRDDIHQEKIVYVKGVLIQIERFDSTIRRRNPWLISLKQRLRALLDELAVIGSQVGRVQQEAQRLL